MFYKTEKIALFIDGGNLWQGAKAHDFSVDFKKLHHEFSNRGRLMRAFYYTAVQETTEDQPVRKLLDFLSYNGFQLRTQSVREDPEPGAFRKANTMLHMQLAMDAITASDHVEHIVIIGGDGHLTPLVQELRRRGVRVTIVGSLKEERAMTSDALRRQADTFVEIGSLRDILSRDVEYA